MVLEKSLQVELHHLVVFISIERTSVKIAQIIASITLTATAICMVYVRAQPSGQKKVDSATTASTGATSLIYYDTHLSFCVFPPKLETFEWWEAGLIAAVSVLAYSAISRQRARFESAMK